jgi:hypothetical protein
MRVRWNKTVKIALLAVSFTAALPLLTTTQTLHNLVASRERVLPQVGSGVIAMREDAAGNVYVLANPAQKILVFDANGKQINQIPGLASGGATISYAVDFDLASNGAVLVADRGANAVYVFNPDGSVKSKVSVFAPTSIVALTNGQFAVTTLRTQHPVEVIDQTGKVIRGFGESHPTPDANGNMPEAPPPLADLGRIVGDSADNVYFAVLSDSDPQVRKYDRFGYAAYEVDVPRPKEEQISQEDRFQVGFNFSSLSRSDQINSWAMLGESGKLQFGANVGVGLAGLLASQGRGGGPGRGGSGGTIAATITGDTSLVQPEFDLHVGMDANRGRGGRGGATAGGSPQGRTPGATPGAGSGAGSTQGSGNSATVRFNDANGFSSSNDSSSDDSAASDDTSASSALQYQSTPSSPSDFSSALPGTVDYFVGTPQMGGPSGGGVGGFSTFFLGGLGPRPGGFDRQLLNQGGMFGGPGGGPPGIGGAAGTTQTMGFPNAASNAATLLPAPTTPNGMHDFGGRGRSGVSDMTFASTFRINLDRPHPLAIIQQTLTAVGVDHKTQEVWAAIGPMIVHFDRDGDAMDTYYLTTPEGAQIQIAAIVVDSNRLLIGSKAGGVYEFDRPDKSSRAHTAQAAATTEKSSAQ